MGWAQERVTYALSKLARTYRNAMLSDDDGVLPDYLIVTDDDTYINLEIFENNILKGGRDREESNIVNPSQYYGSPPQLFSNRFFKDNNSSGTGTTTTDQVVVDNINVPLVWAGCLVRPPISTVNFTSP